MKIIVGIGNPGRKYEFTRHNIGFIVLDKLASKYGLQFKPSKYDFYKAGGEINSAPFILVKPTTYVNNSGIALLDLLSVTPLSAAEDILVIHDEINLPAGAIKIKSAGSSGGHNGIESIIYHLEKDNFSRIRFGIGNTFAKGEMADYVLSNFSAAEEEVILHGIDESIQLTESFITGGYKGMADSYSKSRKNAKNEAKEGKTDQI